MGPHAGRRAVCAAARVSAGRYFGQLGPKRHTGDYQVPEGFYEIYRFNPRNNFHLSLGLNYPNTADRALGEPAPGSDIFIHGGAVTMGYLPIIDAGIEEVYLLTVMARAAGYPGSYFPVSNNGIGVG